jgi:hypothetical protein
MARSVSTPSGASAVAYASFEGESFDFSDCIEDARSVAMSKYPSLYESDKWVGREDRAILANTFCSITVSEYNGLVAVCIVPNEDSNLAANWCSKVDLSKIAGCFGQALRRVGSASNGEAFFQPANGQQQGAMGLGFTSKEGWL